MKSKPAMDIVISTGGRFDMLEKCLNSIYENATVPLTISIIDDATDREKKLMYKHLFEYAKDKDVHNNVVAVHTRRSESKLGFSAAYNMGTKLGNAPLVIMMNDDIEVFPDYFDCVAEAMKDREIGVLGAKLLFQPLSTDPRRPAGKVQHVGVALDIHANSVHPLNGWSPDHPKTKFARSVLAVTGALMCVRRELFSKVGGFDPVYGRGYWEDLDLCLKVRALGYKIWMDTRAGAYHYTNASSEIDTTFGSDFQRNTMIFRSKWQNTGLLRYDSWTYG